MTALHNETLTHPDLRDHHLLPPSPCGRACATAPAVLPRGINHEDLRLFRLIATGLPIEAVARRLDLSERTVRRRTRAACDRLGFGTAIEAIVWAAHRGLI
ncbi:helix-turn-helix domain-containing protein [Kribbella sp. DT2]|uniref:helix-turn-helix domain-containing protein n=1 Tax=Kribbella sp. DT2 TaxID=3393427 RepID=UPI003CE91478